MKKQPANFPKAAHQRGITLIELIVFMVIVGVAMSGIISAINFNVRHSSDPVVKKQALAIAEALLEEIELMPFTICDPDDPNVRTASTAADCTGGAGGANDESLAPLGPEAGETRYAAPFFDNVSDYNGFNMASGAINDVANNNLGLNGYTAAVAVVNKAINGIAAANSLSITVTVTGPLNTTVVLEGYRTRYTPREP
ncbi:MAG TPA: prepilin-type N-terminal cleavage/methylation domain-containing protein [Methylobacter sp.]|jgi:MSHA pilin protein MshD